MEKRLESSVLSKLQKLKNELNEENKDSVNEQQEEEPISIEKLPVFENISNTHFDFESKRFYFDDIYFSNSKIIRM